MCLFPQFSRKLDDLLESLYIDTEIETVEAAKEALAQLQDKIDAIGKCLDKYFEILLFYSKELHNNYPMKQHRTKFLGVGIHLYHFSVST